MSISTTFFWTPIVAYSLGALIGLSFLVLVILFLNRERYSESERLINFFNSIFLMHKDSLIDAGGSIIYSLTKDKSGETISYIGMKFFISEDIFQPSKVEFFFAKDNIYSHYYDDFSGKKFSITLNSFYLTDSQLITKDLIEKAYSDDKSLDIDGLFNIINRISRDTIQKCHKKNKRLITREFDLKNGFFKPKQNY